MKKNQVKSCLDSISEMNDDEIDMNKDFIRNVSIEAYGLIKSLEKELFRRKKKNGKC